MRMNRFAQEWHWLHFAKPRLVWLGSGLWMKSGNINRLFGGAKWYRFTYKLVWLWWSFEWFLVLQWQQCRPPTTAHECPTLCVSNVAAVSMFDWPVLQLSHRNARECLHRPDIFQTLPVRLKDGWTLIFLQNKPSINHSMRCCWL